MADAQPLRRELTHEQEAAVVADRCCWWRSARSASGPSRQIVATYTLTEAECVKCLLQLDKLGFIELRPLNRYRLKVAKGFPLAANGPAMRYFRKNVVDDYFSGGFDAEGGC